MFKRNFLLNLRSLARNRSYSFINITGLATGMAVALLVTLWITDEISFDKSFPNHKTIAQVMITQEAPGEISSTDAIAPPVGYALAKNYPADLKLTAFVSRNESYLITLGEKKLKTTGLTVQPSFTEMFSLKTLEGNKNALQDPSYILVSRSFANALFGQQNATGKVIRLDRNIELKIGGVYEDFVRNSSFADVNVLLSWDVSWNWKKNETSWTNHCTRLYVQINDNSSFSTAEAKMKNLPTPHIKEWKETLSFHPLDKAHLYSEFENGKAVSGPIRFVWLFGIIGVFVLIVACINFMNLSTARSEKRAREVGVRKSLGARRLQVIRHFLNESVFIAFVAFLLCVVLVVFSLNFFNQLANKQMTMPWGNLLFWMCCLLFVLLTGIFAGSYPAFYLSAFNPVKVLKGTFKAGRSALVMRRVLVVIQFSVSIALIIGTIVVFRQVEFAKTRPSGYTREGLITVPLTPVFEQHFTAARNELIQSGAILNMATSSMSSTYFANNNGIEWRGKDPSLLQFFRDVNVSHDFGRTIGWTVLRGRDFSTDHPSDSAAAIINESTAKVMGFEDPVGELITYSDKQYTIIGVVNDMLTQSPYDVMEPSIFLGSGWKGVVTLRLNPDKPVSKSLKEIESAFLKIDPETPFSFRFTDDDYATKFSNEVRIGNLAAFFAVLAIFIACLGLFGLASFIAEQRTKEIGVRKVLGASVISIWKLMSKEFAVLTFISFLVAIPVSWYYMSGWLDNYQYRAPLSWWIFGITAVCALFITLITVSYQAIKAALSNPAKSLRTE